MRLLIAYTLNAFSSRQEIQNLKLENEMLDQRIMTYEADGMFSVVPASVAGSGLVAPDGGGRRRSHQPSGSNNGSGSSSSTAASTTSYSHLGGPTGTTPRDEDRDFMPNF